MNRPVPTESLAPASHPAGGRMSATRTAMLCAVLVALGPISMALYTPAMPTLVNVFGTTIATIKLTLTVYFAGFACAQLACGPLSDAYGRRPVTLAFMLLYLVASVTALVAPSVDVLLLGRFLQGVGAAAGVAVSRAVVRDLFTGQEAARIMNTIGIMLALGPAMSPTIGGITLELSGWHAIFALMVVYGLVVVLLVHFVLVETNLAPDPARARPAGLVAAYRVLLADPRFMRPAIILGASLGSLYALGTILPFVLIDRVGLTPTQFGLGMMAQSLSFATGGILCRRLLVKIDAARLVLPGIVIGMAASFVLALSVMMPVGVLAFSLALIMPYPSTVALAPFPHIAGAAAALMGFVQMGGGLLGSLSAALFGNPVTALGTVTPAMFAIAFVAHMSGLLFPGGQIRRRAPPLD